MEWSVPHVANFSATTTLIALPRPFCQQIVKHCQLRAVQLLNLFLRISVSLRLPNAWLSRRWPRLTESSRLRFSATDEFFWRALELTTSSATALTSTRCGNDFNGFDRYWRLRQQVDWRSTRAHAGMADIVMHRISEVDGRCTGGSSTCAFGVKT